jgi:HK97 family phage portal protein
MAKRIYPIVDGTGIKSSLLWDEETDAWSYSTNAPESRTGALYRTIPTINRAVEITAGAVARIPFAVFKGENEVATSDEWTDPTGGVMGNPWRLLQLISASLDRRGCAYLLKTQNRAGYTKELKWLAASSVEPILDPVKGLTSFKRSTGAATIDYPPEQIVYFWLADPDVEIGPPLSYPYAAARQAAGILHNLDSYMNAYFERGAIRPMIITAKGMPAQAERERLETWFKRMMTGIRNAFNPKVFNAEQLTFQQVGDGLDQLQNQTLTADQRQDVALAFGIPQTILFANSANYATSLSDTRNFYQLTVLPRADFIANVINDQLLSAVGLRFEFQPEGMKEFQEDEAARAGALGQLTTAGVPLVMAMDMLGYDLTEEMRAELEAEEAQPEPVPPVAQAQQEQQPTEAAPVDASQSPEAAAELKHWRRAALKRHKEHRPLPIAWVAEALTVEQAAQISQALKAAATEADIVAAFGLADQHPVADAPDLAYELKRASDLLEATLEH